MRFRDRKEAGQLLAKSLEKYRGKAVIYALPRGGVILGAEIAKHLNTSLDLIITRKVGHPYNPEYAVCAVTEDGQLVCNEQVADQIDPKWLKAEVQKEQTEARRRRLKYFAGRSEVPVEGKVAIITDDGIATGLTMMAAIEKIKSRNPAKIVVAVPVIPPDTARDLKDHGVEVMALDIPDSFLGSVGAYYERFDQVKDDEVIKALNP